MPKSAQSGFIERHVEKIVLAVGAVALAVAAWHYAFSSPNRVEIVGNGNDSSATPQQVDKILRDVAADMEIKARNAPLKTAEPISLEPLENLKLAVTGTQIGPMVALGSPQPIKEMLHRAEPNQKTTLTLAAFEQAAPKPSDIRVMVWPEMLDMQPKPTEVLAAHVAVVYPWDDMKKAWEGLAGGQMQPFNAVMGVQAQVQEQLPDSAWSQPQDVQAVRKPFEVGVEAPQIVEYKLDNLTEVQTSIAAFIENPNGQAAILAPDYWNILGPKGTPISWRVHLPYTSVSDLPIDVPSPDGSVAPAPTVTGTRLAVLPGKAAEVAGTEMPVPPLATQMQAGKVLVWFHDTSLAYSKTYRYRARLILLNPLYGGGSAFVSPVDAKAREVPTPWSDWSDAVSAPKETEFFVIGASPNLGSVSISVFTRSKGQWVSHSFNAAPGQAIGGEALADILQGGSRTKEKINFATGAILVSVEFNKKLYRSAGPSGCTEVVYLDAGGNLRIRVVEVDKTSSRFAALEREVKAAAPPPTTPKPSAKTALPADPTQW